MKLILQEIDYKFKARIRNRIAFYKPNEVKNWRHLSPAGGEDNT